MDVTVHGSSFNVRHLGLVDYQAGLDLQKELVEQRKQGLIPDQLLLLEHPHVITLGARNHNASSNVLETPEALARRGVAVFETGRGGDVTYHGPGQLVGYPIVELPRDRRDVHRYVRDLEEVLIQTVSAFGIAASRTPGLTGIWVGNDITGSDEVGRYPPSDELLVTMRVLTSEWWDDLRRQALRG